MNKRWKRLWMAECLATGAVLCDADLRPIINANRTVVEAIARATFALREYQLVRFDRHV